MKINNIKEVTIIGAGIGGLTAAMLLSYAGVKVHVYEQHAHPGGKMRTTPSIAGPVDSGPTVLTMYEIFKELFLDINEDINQYVNMTQEPLIARHFWRDGSSLDLFSNIEKNKHSIREFSGSKSESEFDKFGEMAQKLFSIFNEPIIKSPSPQIYPIVGNVLKNFWTLRKAVFSQKTLYDLLEGQFSDIRLRQLFARYATYVGGSPYNSPAILALIWHVESQGVWRIDGGMQQLAFAIEKVAKKYGASFFYNSKIEEIISEKNSVIGIKESSGKELQCKNLVYNGDPAALRKGHLGKNVTHAVVDRNVDPRSLSAYVWSFASKVEGVSLAHHNVFFNSNYRKEFLDIKSGNMPTDPTLYVCAQGLSKESASGTREKFEIIVNGPPFQSKNLPFKNKEFKLCLKTTFSILENMGLTFLEKPTQEMLTTPAQFNQLFPGSNGSLYGRSPEGMISTFKRPKAHSKIKGLYLAGGGVHPGPGIPMAALSGRHAAEAILMDLNLT